MREGRTEGGCEGQEGGREGGVILQYVHIHCPSVHNT